MRSLYHRLLVAGSAGAQLCCGQAAPKPIDYSSESFDLHSFVTRPDLQPPRVNVTILNPDKVTEGYIFAAPYAGLNKRPSPAAYNTAQVGPAIYDSRGELVWSGAKLFKDRTTFDLRVTSIDGEPHLSFVLLEDMKASIYQGGAYVILNSEYQMVDTLTEGSGQGTANMHEFQIIDDGASALLIISNPRFVEPDNGDHPGRGTWVLDEGFKEVDLKTRETVFEWWALDHGVTMSNAYQQQESGETPSSAADFFHLNSIDKTPSGNYLISARHVSTIYYVDGKDGSIIWQLGGQDSTFKTIDFNFSGQHDARFISEDSSGMVISIFDNAVNNRDLHVATANCSSAKYIALDRRTRTARLQREIERPDGGLTMLRGNAQTLPQNDNTFIGWSDNNYFSEHTKDLETVLTGSFMSFRFVNYRTWKLPWKSTRPSEDPVAKGYAYGTTAEKAILSLYASWNGATEIDRWRFFAADDTAAEAGEVIADVKRTGFETNAAVDGLCKYFYAEAFTATGQSLGRTATYEVIMPPAWASEQDIEPLPKTLRPADTHSKQTTSSTENTSRVEAMRNMRFMPTESDKVFNIYGIIGMASLIFCLGWYLRRKRTRLEMFIV